MRPCAAAINAPCPTGDYRHHRVSQQPKRLLHQLRKTSPRASKIQQERKETEERISEVPPRGVSQVSLCLQASTRLRTCQQDRSLVSTRTSRDFSRTRRETCARAVATLSKSRPNQCTIGECKHCGASLGRHTPFSSMETKSCLFEEMSKIAGYLPSNAR